MVLENLDIHLQKSRFLTKTTQKLASTRSKMLTYELKPWHSRKYMRRHL
jgi:hypothetical protein